MRSTASSGIESRLLKVSWKLGSGKIGRRRPLSSSNVLCAPRLRRLAWDAPGENVPAPLTSLMVLTLLRLVVTVSVSSISRTLVAPVFLMSSRLITSTGEAPSTSICLMRLPVTSTR